MSSMMIAKKLPASFIPVEFVASQTHCVGTSTSSSSSTSSQRTTQQPNLVDLLQSNYRYLLNPPKKAPTASTSSRPSTRSYPRRLGNVSGSIADPTDGDEAAGTIVAEQRKVRRKGEAFKSPPMDPAITSMAHAPTPAGQTSKDPLVYVGTINYQFILSACQSLSHGVPSNRSPPGSNDHGNSSSSKNSKKKGSRSKANDRSTTDAPSKQTKGSAAVGSAHSSRARKASEEPRSKSTRPSRAASQQRSKASDVTDAAKRTSPTRKSSTKDASAAAPIVEDNLEKKGLTNTKQSSLVPPPMPAHASAHHLAPPSPLRQSAVPVRLADIARASSHPALAALTRSSSQGGTGSSPIVDPESSTAAAASAATARPLKRRRLSAEATLEKPVEEEHDLSKRLRRALAAESLVTDPAQTANTTRPARYGTRYATRSAPNSPPQTTANTLPSLDPLESASAEAAGGARPANPANGRAGRTGALRRTVSHDVLPE
ncbi:hypothetical protein QFC19_000767 [Naganishia cerealis]|uniref:Uncharacterized protein n=1 Tax=Naganishia cerealis TaxID=610337 RepID=A0ACC2WMP3_9TREE|nr:hypothetical protein QFC19_000767 [Naganishia cerealis]